MPGLLTHSPAQITQRLMIAKGLGMLPQPTGNVWPIYVSNEPTAPDNLITVYNTSGTNEGRTFDGERQEHHGVQIRIRGKDDLTAWARANAIAVVLDQDVYQEQVTISGATYRVGVITRTSGPIALGTEPNSSRNIYTINALVSVIQE